MISTLTIRQKMQMEGRFKMSLVSVSLSRPGYLLAGAVLPGSRGHLENMSRLWGVQDPMAKS